MIKDIRIIKTDKNVGDIKRQLNNVPNYYKVAGIDTFKIVGTPYEEPKYCLISLVLSVVLLITAICLYSVGIQSYLLLGIIIGLIVSGMIVDKISFKQFIKKEG